MSERERQTVSDEPREMEINSSLLPIQLSVNIATPGDALLGKQHDVIKQSMMEGHYKNTRAILIKLKKTSSPFTLSFEFNIFSCECEEAIDVT